MVQSAVSLFVDLPLSYQSKINAVAGVSGTCKLQWFGAYYQDPANFFAQFGVDHEGFFQAYPEVELVAGIQDAFSRSPTACLIGTHLARSYGWKIGDRIPLIGTIFPRLDGLPWEFEVVGIYRSTASNVDENTLWFRFDYLQEALQAGAAGGPPGVGVYAIQLDPGADAIRVAAEVDRLFENGPQRVQTTSEAEFQRQFVSMLGSIPIFLSSIGGAILFAILLAAINTMLMSARLRTREFGILQALGFEAWVIFFLLMTESLLVSGGGGLLGVGLFLLAAPSLGAAVATVFPTFSVTQGTMALGILLSLLVGAIAGVIPAWQASQQNCVDALRAEV
jgi:putative ABC transport system permease protein